MVSHGLRLDAEFAAIVVVALSVSLLVSGELVSNALFSSLLVALFFLMGLHIDTGKFRRNLHHRKELCTGLAMVFLVVPAVAFILSRAVGGAVGEALIAIGASTAAIGSPTVFSSIGKGEDGTALLVSASTVFAGVAAVPALAYLLGAEVPVLQFAAKNFALIGLPLAMGVVFQRYENRILEDVKVHFSKLGLWLIALIFGVQLKLVLGSTAFSASELLVGVPVMLFFVAVTYSIGHAGSKLLGINERKSRAIGFVSGSKGLAVALFIASQISGGAVVFVTLYFFARQLLLGGLSEAYAGHLEREFLRQGVTGRFKDWRIHG